MKTQLIAITRTDGSTAMMQYVLDDERGIKRKLVESEVIAEINKALGGYVSFSYVDEKDLPQERTYRNAWKEDLTIDMTKAREIHRDRLREKRAARFIELDTQYMIADEKNDTVKKAQIAQEKQALRDITQLPEIEAAQTVEELKVAGASVLPLDD